MSIHIKQSPFDILQKAECSEDCECYDCSMARLADHQADVDSQVKDDLL